MSIYKACSQACRKLAATGEPFIEIDVVNEAAQMGWSKANFKEAQRHANQIVGTEYRSGRLVRYGPVNYQDSVDYVRKAGRILYADSTLGPEKVKTPNGEYDRVQDRDDSIARVGRRKYAARDDFLPWQEQDATSTEQPFLVDGRPLERRINKLEDDLRLAIKQRIEAEQEVERLRNKLVNCQPIQDRELLKKHMESMILELAGDVDERLTKLERHSVAA